MPFIISVLTQHKLCHHDSGVIRAKMRLLEERVVTKECKKVFLIDDFFLILVGGF